MEVQIQDAFLTDRVSQSEEGLDPQLPQPSLFAEAGIAEMRRWGPSELKEGATEENSASWFGGTSQESTEEIASLTRRELLLT